MLNFTLDIIIYDLSTSSLFKNIVRTVNLRYLRKYCRHFQNLTKVHVSLAFTWHCLITYENFKSCVLFIGLPLKESRITFCRCPRFLYDKKKPRPDCTVVPSDANLSYPECCEYVHCKPKIDKLG